MTLSHARTGHAPHRPPRGWAGRARHDPDGVSEVELLDDRPRSNGAVAPSPPRCPSCAARSSCCGPVPTVAFLECGIPVLRFHGRGDTGGKIRAVHGHDIAGGHT